MMKEVKERLLFMRGIMALYISINICTECMRSLAFYSLFVRLFDDGDDGDGDNGDDDDSKVN